MTARSSTPATHPVTPPARRRPTLRSLAGVAVLALTCTLLPASLAVADDLRDRERSARQDVSRAERELQESSKSVARADRRLMLAESDLAGARADLDQARAGLARAQADDAAMAARLVEAEAELEQARADLAEARDKVASQRADIGRLAATMYAEGDPQLMGLSVLLNSQDPAAATAQLATAESLMSRHDGDLAELREAHQQMVAQEQRVEAATAAVAEQREAAADNLVAREQLEAEAAAAEGQVRALVGERTSARAEATRIRASDRRALAEAEAEASTIRRLILERAAQQRGGYTGSSGGFLQRPVPGSVTSPYGYRTHPIYGYYGLHDGTDFRAPCGTANVASGSGTVISRSYSAVFGNRLYLDLGRVNGKNLTVVYNHLSGYAVSQGARVSRGQVIGYSGSTGWSTGCHLHFTVLENGSPVDPMRYL